MDEVAQHYDLLIDEGNDPVLDPPELAAYMDSWDGLVFLNALALDGTQEVLEVGVGTGRLAVRVAPLSRSFTGIDISAKSIARAGAHLADCPQACLVCTDFMTWQTAARFDVVYSTLTFMHFPDKRAAAARVAALLKSGGRAVISLDKDASGVIDYGTRRVTVYPDDPAVMTEYLQAAGMNVQSVQETAFAYIVTAVKEEKT